MREFRCVDRPLLNDWHVVADRSALTLNSVFTTRLMGHDLQVTLDGRYNLQVVALDTGKEVCSDSRYGFIWACLGRPERDIIYLPETNEADRHLLGGGSIAVRVSGLRAVENFLDMAHFPFVHAGWLSDEPHTEVMPYNVTITAADELLATDCKFHQPIASPTAQTVMVVDYVYKVFRPYTVALRKSSPLIPTERI